MTKQNRKNSRSPPLVCILAVTGVKVPTKIRGCCFKVSGLRVRTVYCGNSCRTSALMRSWIPRVAFD